ncbi:MAG: ABC-F family ATP-binding cassette domain-containing protein [[Clostridium] fimetarium]|nr:ABC-F family ATP-binding cassette domain-containing protein [Alistipes timonensis]MCM1404814.1 ABC-F family ATP-binding cassette domain-containing protein [[Clostridium] fimetarium]
MGVLLQTEKLTKSYGDRLLFGDLTLGLAEGDKVGLVARNGSGKSTLMRCIAGLEDVDSGSVVKSDGVRVAFLDQTPDLPEELSVWEAATSYRPIVEALEAAEPEEREEILSKARRLMSQLGITDFDAKVATQSGGQRKRVALACVLAAEPQVLLLDEPTNHLDIPAIEWLEQTLSRSRVTLLLVTHDRFFLDRVCSRIVEIDRGEVFSYIGNYANYLRRRRERLEAAEANVARAKNLLRKEQEWMRRQPQARAGKAQSRIDAFYDLKERARARQADKDVNLSVKASRIGSKIFEAENVGKRFGDKVILDGFTYTFAPGEKVGIMGGNGVGKSTFVKMLLGAVSPDAGHFDVGETVRFGYYRQEGMSFDPGKRVIDAITERAEEVVINGGERLSPSQFLTRFLFTPADQQKLIAKLSGGERSRLHLASVLMGSPNFLILDEPTNDLDIATLGVLEDYLSEFKGCLIVISHDRYFLDSVADHLFVFEGGGVVKDFPGSYTDYTLWRKERDARERAAESGRQTAEAPRKPRVERAPKLTFKEKKEFEELEKEIAALTSEKEALEALFASGGSQDDIAAKAARFSEVSELLDEKEMRWLELSEKA